MATSPASLLRLALPPEVAVTIRASADSPVLAREPVLASDLADIAAEVWLHCCLRRGFPDVPLAALPLRMLPPKEGAGDAESFVLEARLPNGQRPRQTFSVRSLSHVARRALPALLASGALAEDSQCVYELSINGASPVPRVPAAAPASTSGSVTLRPVPLTYVRRPLAPLQARAREVGASSPEELPVFFARSALERALETAAGGIGAASPVEAGGVLLGSLGWCEDAREFFALVTDAIEVQEPEQTQFSLTFSSHDWAQVNAILKARQAAEPAEQLRLLGQFHAHPFRPMDGVEGGCAQCPKRASCELHSAFMSSDDQVWMHAHYRRQPWALSLIVGLTPRRTIVTRLFGLRDGRWQPRNFHVLPDEGGVPWARNQHV